MAKSRNNNKASDHRVSPSGQPPDSAFVDSSTSHDEEFPRDDTRDAKKVQLYYSLESLSLEQQFDFLAQFSLTRKLTGGLEFTTEEQELIKTGHLDTTILAKERISPNMNFLDSTSNNDNEDRKPDTSSFSDGTGFHPNSVTFRPKRENQEIRNKADLEPDGFHSPYNFSSHESHGNTFIGVTENTTHRSSRPPLPPQPNTTPNVHPTNSFVQTQNTGINANGHQGLPTIQPTTQPQFNHHTQHHHHPMVTSTLQQQPHQQNPTSQVQGTISSQQQHQQYSTVNRMPQGTPHGFMLRAVARTTA